MVELATHLQAPKGKVTQESTNWEEPGTSKIKSVLCDRAYQNVENQPLPSTSRCVTPPPLAVPLVSSCPDKDDITPGKLLQSINPIPVVTPSLKKRTKQLAAILTSPENIAEVKAKALKRKKPTKKITNTKRTKKVAPKKNAIRKNVSSSSESDVDVELDNEDEDTAEDSDADCVGCGETYT